MTSTPISIPSAVGSPDGAMTPARFHVGMNLLWLVPGVVGGSESYVVRLLHGLADAAPADLRFTLFVNRRFAAAHGDLMASFRSVVAPVSGARKPLRVLAETTWLGRQARRQGLDAMHHFGGISPRWQPVPTVLTVHDLQPFAFPEHFSKVKRTFTRLVVPHSVRTATRLTVLSESTRQDLRRRLDVDPDRVHLVPPGFDPPTATDTPADRAAVRANHGLGGRPFFLYPAITYPHKNHELLARAFADLARTRDDVLLVLCGGAAQREQPLADLVASLGIEDRVRRTGRVSDRDLDVLYREAVAMTFPSSYEGFGLPVLEAMSRGCPVIAADATALPEVVGGAGMLVSATDAGAWTRAMAELADHEGRRAVLIRAGRAQAGRFTWAQAAAAQMSVYRVMRDRLPAPVDGSNA